MQGINPNAILAGGFRQRDLFAKDSMADIAALVQFLFRPWNPLAVFGTVRAVIVDPFNRVPFRPFTHVLNEVRKGLFPAFANHYATSAIVRVFLAMRGVASTAHFNPTSSGGGISHTVLDPSASATFGTSGAQITPKNAAHSSAFAFAKPASSTVLKDCPTVYLHGCDDIPWDGFNQGNYANV